ncbi:MAG TPA: CerR family C-terminal domain-containing protein [Lautropia sp.]|nr:CerR family C-terminal domain-containing protein [Lautropia sp.]
MGSRKQQQPSSRLERAGRSDGQATRAHILETGGRMFAERGYADVTSKEISARADANQAAVNYHFGSKDGLYEAVLIEAHRQLVDFDQLSEWTAGAGDARDKLRAVLAHLMSLALRKEEGWAFRVLLRELLTPSPLMPALISNAVRPKARLLLGLVAEITGLPPEHPTAQRGLFFTVVPCILMALAPQPLKAGVLPAINRDPQVLADELMRYVLAGLEAVATAAKPAVTSAPRATTTATAKPALGRKSAR